MNTSCQEMQILLVEDNPSDAEITLDALRECDLFSTAQWAKDGAEALEILFANGPDSAAERRRLRLVLLDLQLPRVGGLEVLRALRADERTRLLPVVMMTSSREEMDLARAYELGANSYVVKPVESDAFMSTVRELGLYWMLRNQLPGQTK